MKAAAPAIDPSTQALLQRIERLEAALRGAVAAPPTPAVPRGSGRAPEPAPRRRRRPRADARRRVADAAQPAAAGPEPPAPHAGRRRPRPPQPPSPPPAVAVAVAAPVALELESLRAVWPAVLEELKTSGNTLCAHRLAETRAGRRRRHRRSPSPSPRTPSTPSYHMRKADDDEDRACVAEAIRTLTGGAKPQIAYVLGERGRRRRGAGAAAPTDSEWVERFVAEFDAEEIHPESEAS